VNRLIVSSAFQRAAKRLSARGILTRETFATALYLLEEDASHPRLKTHKLKEELDGLWACSLGYDLRIIFRFVEHEGQQAILLETIGTHDEVH
jgi:mRNA-degrading endonuclease YafQ of YafQ-DinJ toxin-antitoxin module